VAPWLAATACGSSGSGSTSASQAATGKSPGVEACRLRPRAPAQPASPPAAQLDPTRTYTVQLITNCGPIVIQLAVKEAPKTASSFAHLVNLGYYNGLTFHRVVPNFVIQGGDPLGNGTGGPSWKVVEPPPANLRYAKRGRRHGQVDDGALRSIRQPVLQAASSS